VGRWIDRELDDGNGGNGGNGGFVIWYDGGS
jgi:hypothetical protein